MNKSEVLDYLIHELLAEQPQHRGFAVPESIEEKKMLFRSLVNIRPAHPMHNEFLRVQDEYLYGELSNRGIVEINELKEMQRGLYLWQGDITTLKVDAIVNAANRAMLGCFVPCHGCIDNAIHTYAGVQLRLECAELMKKQGREEATGSAKITKAYNLPSRYILHTVGPVIQGKPTAMQCEQLASCYRSCLELADSNHLNSIAFCCISTGEFCFPNRQAAEIAVQTVCGSLPKMKSVKKVIFNVYKKVDYEIYTDILTKDK